MKKNNEKVEKSLKLLAKSSTIVLIGVILSKIFTYIYRVIIARHFGPEIYGLFTLAFMVTGIFTSLIFFGLGEGLLRFIPLFRGKKEINKIRYVFKFSVKFLFFSSLLGGLLLFLLADTISIKIFHNEGLIIFLKIFSLSIPFSIFLGIFLSIIRSFEKISGHSFISNILQPAINVLFLIFLIFLGMKVNSVIFSHLLSVIVTLSLAFFFCKHKLPKIFKKEHLKKETKKFIKRMLISYSWPIMFAGIIGTIFYWADSFVIGFFENAKSVGYYNAAIPIVMLLMLVPSLFTQLFAPLITREFSKRNREIIKEISKQVVKWIFILNLPLFILMFIFPGTIINILFGKDYLIATNALRILSIGGILSSPVYIFNSLLFMIGKSRLFLANLIISSSVNIFLNVVLVPKYSITGAALATAISWILLTLILFFETKRYLDIIPLRRKMFRVLLASIIPTILALYLRANLTASLISLVSCSFLFILLYVFSMFLTGSLDKNDVMILRTIKRKIISR